MSIPLADKNPQSGLVPSATGVFFTLCLLLVAVFAGLGAENKHKKNFELHEKAIINYYKSPKDRKKAYRMLSRSCKYKRNPLSCYNLAILFYSENNFQQAARWARKAAGYGKGDDLYQSILQLTAVKSGNLDLLKNTDLEAYSYTLEMIKCKDATSETSCLSALYYKDKKYVNFSRVYYEEKQKQHKYSKVWDTSFHVQNKALPDEGNLSSNITRYWRDFRKSVKNNQPAKARSDLLNFKKELLTEKHKNPRLGKYYQALEDAAKLLIAQDKFYKNVRNLAQEL